MTNIRIDGVKETLVTLRKFDPEMRKTFAKNVRQITKPLVSAAQSRYPSQAFPSGTARNWAPGGRPIFPLTANKAARGVKSGISTSKRNASTISVTQTNPGAAVYEFAQNGGLGQAFSRKSGAPARVMWPAAEATQPAVSAELERYILEVADYINKELLL